MHSKRFLILATVLSLGLASARAQEAEVVAPPVPPAAPLHPTALAPEGASVIFRLPTLDRMDEIGRDLAPVLAAFGQDGPLAQLGKTPASQVFLSLFQLGPGMSVARDRPVYACLVDEDDFMWMLPAAKGVAWEGERELLGGNVAYLRGVTICLGTREIVTAKARGVADELVDGDVCARVLAGSLIEKNRAKIVEGFAALEGNLGEVPEKFRPALAEMLGFAEECVFGLDTFDYSVSLRGNQLISEGKLGTRGRSRLKEFLRGAPKPVAHSLAGFLPQEVFIASSGSGSGGFYKAAIGFIDKHLGEGTGATVLQAFDPSVLFPDKLTGNSAGGMALQGMMGASSVMIYEVTEPKAFAEALAAHSAEPGNKKLVELGVPEGMIEVVYEPNVAKDGETAIHRMQLRSNAEEAAMLLMSMGSTYVAVEDKYLLIASGMSGEQDLRDLIGRVRKGLREDHPHIAAMRALKAEHHAGLSFNLGALKPFAMMLIGMQAPELGPMLQAIPERMYFSTACWIEDGDLRWRGDWPLQDITAIAQAYLKAKEEAELGEGLGGEDEEFD